MFVIGPALRFLLGGTFLGLYTDLDSVVSAPAPLTPSHPLWVGAWWMGFALAVAAAWAGAFAFSLYPAALPSSRKHNQVSGAPFVLIDHDGFVHLSQVSSSDGFTRLRDLPLAIKALLCNPTYMFINLGGAMDGFSISGLSTFLPKWKRKSTADCD